MSEYTAQEIATLQSRLEKQLGPEYLSSRAGPSGQKVHYIAAEKCIALANEVFGFNGWSSAIKEIQVDFVDEHPQTLKVSLGLSVIVRVTLRDGTFHEDIGYGHIENCSGKAKAFEKAKKEGTTDALKRALRNFGNVLGNCIYDKDYVKKVTKMKIEPKRTWDETGLHRHADFVKRDAVVKLEMGANGGGTTGTFILRHGIFPRVLLLTAYSSICFRLVRGSPGWYVADVPRNFSDEATDTIPEFDEVDFNIVDEDHPDEVSVPQSEKPTPHTNPQRPNPQRMQPPSRPLARSHSAGSSGRPPQTPGQAFPRPGPQNSSNQAVPRPQHPLQQQTNQPRPQNGAPAQASKFSSNGPHQTPPQAQGQDAAPLSEGVGFFSARAVKQLAGPQDDSEAKLPTAPLGAHAFNPHAESPSIRKTPGIDHTKSKPVGRNGQHVAPAEKKDGDLGGRNPGPATTSVGAGAGAGRAGPGANVGGGLGAGAGQQQGLAPVQGGNIVNPQLSQARRIGAPIGPGSPLGNRGQYRPPTIKRPLANESNHGAARPALSELSANGSINAAPGGGAIGGDPKRQKMG